MLQKSDARDDLEACFAHWRAMLPVWSADADRFRAAALEARGGTKADPYLMIEAEEAVEACREALLRCDALLSASLPGDPHLLLLVNASAEFESLLASLHRSLDLMAEAGLRPQRRQNLARIPAPSYGGDSHPR